MKRTETTPFPDTLCVHAGQGHAPGDPLVTPLVQSTTFCSGSEGGHAYSRVSNPTVAALEETLGQMEHAPPAVCFGSGLAAEAALFLALLKSGDHIVCSRAVYGGTTRLLQQLLIGFGIETSFVNTSNTSVVAEALKPTTRLVFIETPANPTLDVSDIKVIADIAHQAGAILAVDNTFLTAVLQQPLELGADCSVYSTTKLIEGHSAALGGAVVSHDVPLLERLRFVRKCTGGIQAPFNAWLTLQGLKTLPLRIRQQSENARAIVSWLVNHPAVTRVYYPSCTRSRAQHLGHDGAVVAFELRDGLEAARQLAKTVELCRFVEHVGSVETLITHPATMTHADVPKEQRESVGITDGLVRLSIGLESIESIIADLDQALASFASQGNRCGELAPCLVKT